MIAARVGRPIASHWNARTVAIKMAGCAAIAAVVVGTSVLWTSAHGGEGDAHWTPLAMAGTVLFGAVCGALIGYCLALSDLVLQRRMMGQRVNPLLRAYFSAGLLSLLLWSVTLFAAGVRG